jgi:RsiW-degrading membrane proteinase PrsW (M82 family)
MQISIRCDCGKDLRANGEHAGKKGRCPECGRVFTIPAQSGNPVGDAASEPVARAPALRDTPFGDAATAVAPSRVYAQATPGAPELSARPGLRLVDRLYLVLLLALAPLFIHTFFVNDDVAARWKATLNANPQVLHKMDQEASLDDVLNSLPEHRIAGASFGRDTQVHWLLGMLSAVLFFGLGMSVLRSKDSKAMHLLAIGLFTGTVGILLLLGFQYVADWTQGVWVRGTGIVTLLFYVVKFIGFSYRAAEDPSNGFALSFVGFTCGVGFCEELCKALPLFWHFRKKDMLSWRGACVWGLVSGAGFGLAEGIMYCYRYYNGIQTGGIYWVRFISCVALHAAWSAAVGITLYRNRAHLQGEKKIWELLIWAFYLLLVPMLLHGAYDTLLKQGENLLAIVAAVASLGWLAFQIERMGKEDQRQALARA